MAYFKFFTFSDLQDLAFMSLYKKLPRVVVLPSLRTCGTIFKPIYKVRAWFRFDVLWYRSVLPIHIDGSVQESRNCSALAKELCYYCTNPSIYASGWFRNHAMTLVTLRQPGNIWIRLQGTDDNNTSRWIEYLYMEIVDNKTVNRPVGIIEIGC